MSTHLQLFDGCATVAKGHRVIDANDCVDMINLDEFFEHLEDTMEDTWKTQQL